MSFQFLIYLFCFIANRPLVLYRRFYTHALLLFEIQSLMESNYNYSKSEFLANFEIYLF
jgi:hypothetical protein